MLLSKIERDNMKTPAYAYDRVSTLKQENEGMSLEYQARHAQKYANEHNLEIIKSYSSAESAFKEGRKNFNRMLDDALRNNIKDIIFKNTDRLGRNDVDWARCKKLAREQGFRIHLYELGTVFCATSSAEEEVFLDNTAAFAKYWSNKISQSIKRVNNDKAERGIRPATCPQGYKYDKQQQRYIFDFERKEVMQFLFDEFDNNNISINTLAKRLNAKGYRTAQGKLWKRPYLHAILSNEFYAGKFYKGVELADGTQDKYVSFERFMKRQGRKGERWHGTRKYNFAFSNMLISSGGRKLTPQSKQDGKYIYYMYAINADERINLKEEKILSWIDKEVAKVQYTDISLDLIKNTFKNIINDLETSRYNVEKSITKQISDLREKQKKLLNLWSDQEFPIELLRAQVKEWEEEIKMLGQQMANVGLIRTDMFIEIADIIDSLREFPLNYAIADKFGKAEYLRSMSHKIIILDDSAKIVWREPFKALIEVAEYEKVLNGTEQPIARDYQYISENKNYF